MRHLELFAGIGGFRLALDLLTKDNIQNFECVGFSEIDSKACDTYCSNYDTSKEIAIGDIVSFTSKKENIEALPDFELLTGGFPCQTFSMMGKQAGFNEDRGQMFFRILDILEIKRPPYVLLENVKNLFTHDKGNTFKRIKGELENLGYRVYASIFNSADFHLPQKRNRVIIFATLKAVPSEDFYTAEKIAKAFDTIYQETSVLHYQNVLDLLDKNVDEKYYLSERIKPTILSDGSGGFKSKSEIDQMIARPLTATMHKMHRACQDNYYSQNFIMSSGEISPSLSMSKEELAKLKIRKLTPEEAFELQGFPRIFVQNARKHKVADGALYKQAGNAVSVNVIYAIAHYLLTNRIME